MTPLKPPKVNIKTIAMANNIGVSKVMAPRHMVAMKLKIISPTGMEIMMVPIMK